MGFFRLRRKKKTRKPRDSLRESEQTLSTSSRKPSPRPEDSTTENEGSDSTSTEPLPLVPTTSSSNSPTSLRLQKSISIDIDAVPALLDDLETAKDTSGDRPARALRKLFTLSEHESFEENRTEMVRVDNGRLAPVLLSFLERCCKGSSEQKLTLLVLNNVSIPTENKRLIAIDHGGARLLGRLLCDNPSHNLVAIVLVNLTFADAEVRRELVSPGTDAQLIETLAFTLRVASLTQEEYELRVPLVENDPENLKTPCELLANLLAEDVRQRVNSPLSMKDTLARPSKQLFAESARWCLTAIKNLTRPSKVSSASARALIHSGIVPHILRFITVPSMELPAGSSDDTSDSDEGSPMPAEPVTDTFANAPSTWDSNSEQDAALFVILNLSAEPSAREYLRELGTMALMSTITVYDKNQTFEKGNVNEKKIIEFQCLKARMALAYLLGAEGHFGQPRARSPPSLYLSPNDSLLVLSEREATHFVKVLADTLHHRPRDGPGGYSAATFSLNYFLLAIRCLLTSEWNQILFANVSGPKLNALLMKVLAQHAIEKVPYIDAKAAEHASFSLYLLSHHGFEHAFLPASFGHKKCTNKSLAAKVWAAYVQTGNITAPGLHAVQQLMLRLKYLLFEGSPKDIAESNGSDMIASDLTFSDDLLAAADKIFVEKIKPGAKPRQEILGRPILRSRPPTKGSRHVPWDNYAAIDSFPSALVAVHELSYASSKVRHIVSIDDILIANNLVNSANGEKTESYNYMWSWQDNAGEVNKNLERQKLSDSSFSNTNNETENAFWGLRVVGNLCACDTTEH